MAKRCLNCGGDMSAVNAGAKFCSSSCKNRYNYDRKKRNIGEKKVKDGLKGVEPTIPEMINESVREKDELKNQKLPPLRNTMWINMDEDESESGEKEAEELKIGDPPPQYLTKEVQKENVFYKSSALLIQYNEARKTEIQEQLKKLGEALRDQQSRNGNGFIILGAVGGGIWAYSGSEEKVDEEDMVLYDKNGRKIGDFSKNGKRKRKRKDTRKKVEEPKDSFWVRVGKILIGVGAGLAAKRITEPSREADKQGKITAINKKITELTDEMKILDIQITDEKRLLGNQPPMLTTKVTYPNPDYAIYLEKVKKAEARNKESLSGHGDDGFKPHSNKISSVKNFSTKPVQVLLFDGCWKEFFDNPSTNFHCLIHGNAGEGKSTFCLWFARYLAENFGRVLYVSGEEGLSPTMLNKLRYCKAEGVTGLHIADIRTGEELMKEVKQGEFHFVILDSLRDMGIDADMMKEIWNKFPDTAFIAIEQNNKKGDIYGRNDMKHSFDIVVNIVNYTAETTKNRFKQKGISLKTAEFGQDFEKGGTGLKVVHRSPKSSEDDDDINLDIRKIV